MGHAHAHAAIQSMVPLMDKSEARAGPRRRAEALREENVLRHSLG